MTRRSLSPSLSLPRLSSHRCGSSAVNPSLQDYRHTPRNHAPHDSRTLRWTRTRTKYDGKFTRVPLPVASIARPGTSGVLLARLRARTVTIYLNTSLGPSCTDCRHSVRCQRPSHCASRRRLRAHLRVFRTDPIRPLSRDGSGLYHYTAKARFQYPHARISTHLIITVQ